MGNRDTSKRIVGTSKIQGGADGVQSKKIPDNKNTSAIITSEEELLVISEQNEVNLVGDESTWVIDSGASVHLTRDRRLTQDERCADRDIMT